MYRNTKWQVSENIRASAVNALRDNLCTLRKKVGLSQGNISKLLGVSRQTYCAVEKGKKKLTWNLYLSLILVFDYNENTHFVIRDIGAYPEEIEKSFNMGERMVLQGQSYIAGIPSSITAKLDEQALHSVKTAVMIEFARCSSLSDEEVIKAFSGKSSGSFFKETDISTQKAIMDIKEENEHR